MSMSDPFLPIFQSHAASYIIISSLAVFVYDIIATLPDEIEHIWRANWTLPKALYLIVRYWALAIVILYVVVFTQVQHSVQRCKALAWFYITLGANVLSPLVNVILSLRLYALYHRSKKVLVFLTAVITGEVMLQIIMGYDQGKRATDRMFLADPGFPLLGCLSFVDKPELTLTQWIPLFVVAATFFIMTLYRLMKTMKSQRGTGISITVSPLYQAFIRGGAVFFLIVTIVFPISAFICLSVKNPLNVSYQPWLTLALSMTGSRLILSLRQAETRDVVMDNGVLGMRTWNAQTTLEPITFA
ncbi:hypothetical protein BJ165DRAFT_1508650 [Panaeolus papilionaceus]|nr:hypothetical protein BJ165DRAFT_1508650 [Panaeolus papilionaceus]